MHRLASAFIGALAFIFFGYGAFDMYFAVAGHYFELAEYTNEFVGWVHVFPMWRKLLWGVTSGFGMLGALLIIARRRHALHFLLLSFFLMVIGRSGYDLLVPDRYQRYGESGVLGSAMILFAAMAFIVLAYGLRRLEPVSSRV